MPLYAWDESGFTFENADALKALGKLSEVKVFENKQAWQDATEGMPVSLVGGSSFCLYMEVDVAAEKVRLGKEATRLEGELIKVNAKLANEAFVSKVPPAVLAQEQKRLQDFTTTLEKIQEQLARLK